MHIKKISYNYHAYKKVSNKQTLIYVKCENILVMKKRKMIPNNHEIKITN